jgi:hypothetical protein
MQGERERNEQISRKSRKEGEREVSPRQHKR